MDINGPDTANLGDASSDVLSDSILGLDPDPLGLGPSVDSLPPKGTYSMFDEEGTDCTC